MIVHINLNKVDLPVPEAPLNNILSPSFITNEKSSKIEISFFERWDFPLALAVDLDGELLVCDTANHCLRKVYVNEFDQRVSEQLEDQEAEEVLCG